MVGLALVMWRHRPSSAAAGGGVGPVRTVVAAVVTHLWELTSQGGWTAVPWHLVPERVAQRFFSILFLAIGALFPSSVA